MVDHLNRKRRVIQFVLTPHVAFASQQAFEKRAVIVVENLKQFLAGTPQNLV